MKFACSFAWADLEVHPAEWSFFARLLRRMQLDEADEAQVQEWLRVPPVVDPTSIPTDPRAIFLASIDG